MDRKEFLSQVGLGAAILLVPACLGGLAGCKKTSTQPTSVDFTVDTGTGPLAVNGGSMVKNAVIIARTNTGSFIAVAAGCTHEGTTVNYNAAGNKFICPNHGAQFSSTGNVTMGPASTNLKQYNTSLSGTTLRVFS